MAQDIPKCRGRRGRGFLPRVKCGERIGEGMGLELEPDLKYIQRSYAEAAIADQ